MKYPLKMVVLMMAASIAASGASASGSRSMVRGGQNRATAATLAVAPLTTEEAATLLWMREEEKLARDVYLGLDAKWHDRVFARIAKSEQRHFDATGDKIVLFGLIDPALPTIGAYFNTELQLLYNELMALGGESLVEALRVGAAIEERDIADLMAAMTVTANPALLQTYGHLLEGSKNHLRTFVARLAALGAEYVPRELDPMVFDAIVGP